MSQSFAHSQPDSAGDGDSDSSSQGQLFEEDSDATGSLAKAYKRIHQLNKMLLRGLVPLRAMQREVCVLQLTLKRSEEQCAVYSSVEC